MNNLPIGIFKRKGHYGWPSIPYIAKGFFLKTNKKEYRVGIMTKIPSVCQFDFERNNFRFLWFGLGWRDRR